MAHGRISSPVDGPTVRKLREHRGFNLRKLADLSGVSNSQISKIERGISRPRSLVSAAPPFTADQRDRIRRLVAPVLEEISMGHLERKSA